MAWMNGLKRFLGVDNAASADGASGPDDVFGTGESTKQLAPRDETSDDAEPIALETADVAAAKPDTTSITDFTPEDDSLLLVWDDTIDEIEPDAVSLQVDPDNAGQLQVLMGDRVMAQVSGDVPLNAADLAMIPLSSAQALHLVGP